MTVAKTASKTTSRRKKTVAGTNSLNWVAIIAIGWVLLLGASMYERYRPATDWFNVKSIHVADTTVGTNPVMQYARDIKQPFRGDWTAEVQYLQPSGKWIAECIATGVANYAPDKGPPNPTTLDWWTYPLDCAPKHVGTYRLSTSWNLDLPGGITKQIFAFSNTFKVTE